MNSLFPGIKFVLLAIPVMIAAWLVVHLLSLAGIFLAGGYLIWWVFFPKNSYCFMCRAKEHGEMCPFCNKTINDRAVLSPRSLRSVILNCCLILILTMISVGIVGSEMWIIRRVTGADKIAAMMIIPPKRQYKIGEIFPVQLEIADMKAAVNTVQIDLKYDPNMLELMDFDTGVSFASVFVQKQINNALGYGRISGGLPNPGYTGERGVFATSIFKAKSPGMAVISFLPSSMVLANDGKGTNILRKMDEIPQIILPDKITEEEAKIQSEILGSKDSVLGVNTGETKLTFWEEDKVLGDEFPTLVKSSESKWWEKIGSGITKIDESILGIWKAIVRGKK